MGEKYIVHIEDDILSKPRDHELSLAQFLADYFKSDVIFLGRNSSKTPDLYVIKTNLRWELKSPIGGSKHTIQNNLREAEKQSKNIILDLSRAKLSSQQGASRAKEFIRKERSGIRKLLVVTKTKTVIDIKAKT